MIKKIVKAFKAHINCIKHISFKNNKKRAACRRYMYDLLAKSMREQSLLK